MKDMHFEAEIVSTNAYVYNKVLGKICFYILIILGVLVYDKKLEGGLLRLFDVHKSVYIFVWILLFITLVLSIYLPTIKYILGKLFIDENNISIELDKAPNIRISYSEIDRIVAKMNKKPKKDKYVRGIKDAWKNWIIIYSKLGIYKYEFSIKSIKQEEDFLTLISTLDQRVMIEIEP